MKKSTKIILAVLGVSTVVLTLVGITVAFFSASITGGNESITANTVVLGSLSGTGDPITLENAEPGSEGTTKNYSVSYSSGATVAKKYSLSLVITDNDFVNTVLDSNNSSTTQNGQLVITLEIAHNAYDYNFNSSNSGFVTYKSDYKTITIDATNSSVAKAGTYKLLTDVYIEPGEIQKYAVSVKLNNLDNYNQNDNQGKSFNGYLTIEDAIDTELAEKSPALRTITYLNNSSNANANINLHGTGIVNRTETSNAEEFNYTGVFKDTDTYGDTYFFRGNVTNNYVKFAGFFWRIIRVNGDGTLRLIYDGTSAQDNGVYNKNRYISTGAYNSSYNSNAYVGYMYGNTSGNSYNSVHANTNSSTIKTTLDTWYENNLKDYYASYIADEIFCNDRSIKTNGGSGYGSGNTEYASFDRAYTQGTPSFLCNRSPYTGDENKTGVNHENHDAFTVSDTANGNGDLTYPIGLITLDEYIQAGFRTGNYLDRGKISDNKTWDWVFWSLSPRGFGGGVAYVISFGGGDFDYSHVDYAGFAVAPVINLTAEASLMLTGAGTKTSPFELPSDK